MYQTASIVFHNETYYSDRLPNQGPQRASNTQLQHRSGPEQHVEPTSCQPIHALHLEEKHQMKCLSFFLSKNLPATTIPVSDFTNQLL